MAQTRTINFPDGDYPACLNAAYAAYMAALEDERQGKAEQLLATEDPASEVLRVEYEELKAESDADARKKNRIVTLRALGRSKWRPLKKAHPVRVEGDGVDAETAKADRLAGVNREAVEDDLVHASIETPESLACAGDPRNPGAACSPGNPCSHRAAFVAWADDELSEGEFQVLASGAWKLVNVASIDPKSLPSSPTRSDDES